MTLQSIKKCVDNGITIHWSNELYQVIKDANNEYLILCTSNESCVGLTFKNDSTKCTETNMSAFYPALPF
jgi:aryl-phospho-beta-D-glucosidase BglC (GH1 family)